MAADSEGAGYLRVLTRFDATMLVIGCIVGAGVFFTPYDIAREAPDVGSMLGVWVLGGVIALTGSLTFAELGGLFPRAGGVYVFIREAFGDLVAFLYAWAITLIIAPGAIAWVADSFAENLTYFVPLSPVQRSVVAAAIIVSLTALNIRGVRWGSSIQNLFTGAKLLAIVLMIGAGLAFVGDPVGPVAAEASIEPRYGPTLAFFAAMMPVMFSYGGWQNATFVAAEVKDPARNVPLAMIVGTLVVITVYILINVAFLQVLTPEAIGADRAFASRAAEAALGSSGGAVVAAGILVSVFGICAAMLLVNPRVAQALANDGLFFRPFARLHPRFRTPDVALVVLALWSCALLFLGKAGQLLNSVVFADWVFFTLAAVALFVFRKRLPGAGRPYRCHGYPWVPGLFLVLAATMAVITFVKADATARILGPGLLAVAAPAFYLFRWWQAQPARSAP